MVGCGVVLGSPLPLNFSYQNSDPADNDPIGVPDTPVDIPADGARSFVLSFTPTAEFPATVLRLVFDCSNARSAAIVEGLNDFILSASINAEADVIATARTLTSDGRVVIVDEMGEFAVGAINIGPDESVNSSLVRRAVSAPSSR